jgi:hypothetical protein
MATYLQGVTDYIPQFQPFQPDLNFYGNVLQTKQTQYDTNWKAMNKMYGQYYHAELTRDPNIAKKDNYLKQAEFNLKRVSQLDLSLEQNVTQAAQIFKPFYEDKGLMKDMAWTKNFNRQYGMAQSYKGAYDDKQRAKYWDVGLREMDYMKDEFKNASEGDAMSFGNVQYTPYVNTVKEAQKLAKESGLSIESVDFSEDKRFIVKTKNGEQLIEPLQKLFEAELGSNPGIQAVYKSQAYVNRKDYAYSNAAQFGGDKDKAEMKYLEDSFNVLKEKSVARYNQLRDNSTAYDKRIKDLEEQKKNGKASPEVDEMLKVYQTNKEINDKVLSRAEQDNEMINGGESKTTTTSTGFQNPYGDVKSLRWKVDNGMASLLMQKDLDEAAHIFAYKDAKQDIDANPYAVLADKHQYSMQQIAARNAGLERAARLRNKGEMDKVLTEAKLKAGTHRIDEETGQLIPIEALNEMYVEPNDKGNTTDKLNFKELSNQISRMKTQEYAMPYLQNTLALVERFVTEGTMTKQQASEILGYSRFKNISVDKFSEKLNGGNAQGFIKTEIGSKDLAQIEKKMNNWLTQNGQLSGLSGDEYKNYQSSAIKFSDYNNYLKANQDWLKKTSKIVTNELSRKGYKNTSALYDDKGNLNTKDEYVKKLSESGVYITSSIKDDYDDLVKAAGSVYSSDKISKTPGKLPGIDQIGELSGTGLFTTGMNATWVNPKSVSTKGNLWFNQVLRDYNKVDWGDTSKNRVTFNGISKTSFDERSEKGYRNNEGKALLDAIRAEMIDPKTKMGNFRIGVSPIAAGKVSKAAIVIHPDAEWLKGYVYNTDKNGKATSGGMISQDQYNLIMKNGISYITDAQNMSNELYTQAYKSPLASYVDYYGSYTYTDPANPKYKLNITKNKTGTGDYNTLIEYPLYNPQTGEYTTQKIYDNLTTQGGNMEKSRNEVVTDYFPKIKEFNIQLNNQAYE